MWNRLKIKRHFLYVVNLVPLDYCQEVLTIVNNSYAAKNMQFLQKIVSCFSAKTSNQVTSTFNFQSKEVSPKLLLQFRSCVKSFVLLCVFSFPSLCSPECLLLCSLFAVFVPAGFPVFYLSCDLSLLCLLQSSMLCLCLTFGSEFLHFVIPASFSDIFTIFFSLLILSFFALF